MTENTNSAPITASEWAAGILTAEQHKDSERYFPMPIVISYTSTFLPDGSHTVCYTRQSAERQIAALVFHSNGDEEAKGELRDRLMGYLEMLDDPDFKENSCHYGYAKTFPAPYGLSMACEYDMYQVIRGSASNPMPRS